MKRAALQEYALGIYLTFLFFSRCYLMLNAVGVKTLADIRLWRTSRFVSWASSGNLEKAFGEKYKYFPELAPTKELLTEYKNGNIDWNGYEKVFNAILSYRKPEELFNPETLDKACFLCTEKTEDKCHRRLVAEYLQKYFGNAEIIHL